VTVPHQLHPTLPLPPEIPIEPVTVVAMTMERFRESDDPNPWRGSGVCVVGVVGGVNYGQAESESRNHWRYHVVWESESWSLERPDGEIVTMSFSSERSSLGWPHLWRHDLLTPMRGLPEQLATRDVQARCRHLNRETTGWSQGSVEHLLCLDCGKRWSD